jgi:N-acetylneuraminic acid mutarotase
MHPPMPTPRSGIAAVAMGHRIYVFGGEAPEGTFDTVEVFDSVENRWIAAATSLPTARHGMGAAAHHGRIFVIAGGTSPGGSTSALNEIFTPVQ